MVFVSASAENQKTLNTACNNQLLATLGRYSPRALLAGEMGASSHAIAGVSKPNVGATLHARALVGSASKRKRNRRHSRDNFDWLTRNTY